MAKTDIEYKSEKVYDSVAGIGSMHLRGYDINQVNNELQGIVDFTLQLIANNRKEQY
ncbi:hypothetical protein [Weissella muntiaci]|uniref:hypothetical protein n=1 Tax=Weissella muntiaci TaxID=2508881 RepID=UPI0016523479|nr:hypothetical protein [Weissella muntiaci]